MSGQPMLDNLDEYKGLVDSAHEAGVSELQELYERIEGTYARAAVAASEAESVHASDSTAAMISYAYLGPDT